LYFAAKKNLRKYLSFIFLLFQAGKQGLCDGQNKKGSVKEKFSTLNDT